MVRADIRSDQTEPRREAVLPPEASDRAQRSLENFLNRVLGLSPVAEPSFRLGQQHRVVSSDDGIERIGVAAAVVLDECSIATGPWLIVPARCYRHFGSFPSTLFDRVEAYIDDILVQMPLAVQRSLMLQLAKIIAIPQPRAFDTHVTFG